jgi:apolipoprotein N-acyltransferase
MTAAELKGLLALAAACVFLGVSAVLFLTHRSFSKALQALGLACFGVMAFTHVFESFAIFPTLGWGQARSVGHLIDLSAALLGVAFVTASLLLRHGNLR